MAENKQKNFDTLFLLLGSIGPKSAASNEISAGETIAYPPKSGFLGEPADATLIPGCQGPP
jgi:hypothetical protein